MAVNFRDSMFFDLLKRVNTKSVDNGAILGGITGSSFDSKAVFDDLPIVVFDFETTGLDVKTARIIEIGAVKFRNRKEVARLSTLVNPGMLVSSEITEITGLDNEMLKDAPKLDSVLHEFHDFLRGSVGVAHNAEYDCNVLAYESARMGIQCSYTVICTLRMARTLVDLPKRNLDALAQHFGLSFESRHRSIGDILVTAGVLWKMLEENPHLKLMRDFESYQEPIPKVQ